ncbi:hypothetical protein QFC22_004576 [Naganishia vaughanmartiniae]|uniref:Uncharacterized protein n=1 Tax=Naganishia vaughanmartiniae TaxID=1424756 RepID=A0ACC2WYS9_9TREE|nr:hypothetical protein QFC22_004576 [Naganishia vaughanmartiniae]
MIPKASIAIDMEDRPSTRAGGKGATDQSSKYFAKQDIAPVPLRPPKEYHPTQTSSTYGGTNEQAGLNNRKARRATLHSSPYTVGLAGSSSKNKAKSASTLAPVAPQDFYKASSSNTVSSKRPNPKSLPSPSNEPIDLAQEPSMEEQELIEVDPGESEEEIESPEIAHVSSVGPMNGTPTGSPRNRPSNGTESMKPTTKTSIFSKQAAAGPPSGTSNKPSTVQAKPIPPRKAGISKPSYIGPLAKNACYSVTSVIIDNHTLPPEEVKTRFAFKTGHLTLHVARTDNAAGKDDLTIPLDSGTKLWIASKNNGPVTALMIDCQATQKVRTDWYREFASISNEPVKSGRSRFILLVELGEGIEMSKLLRSCGDFKPYVVLSNEILKSGPYHGQLQSFEEEMRLASLTPQVSASETKKAAVPTRPAPKGRSKVDQPETSDREGVRPTRTQPGRSARTTAAAEPREPPIKKKPLPKNPDEIMREWPSNGRSEVNITHGDFHRLEEAEYLNDTLIEFGLKYNWAALSDDKEETPQQFTREDIHIFNSFFYKKLSVRNRPSLKEANPEAPSWPAYETVRKWTRKVDIFSKKMLVIPINENLHWYLAIILNPGGTFRKRWLTRESAGAAETVDMTAEQKEAELSNEIAAEKRKEVADQAKEVAARTNSLGAQANASTASSNCNSDDGEDPLNVIGKPDEDTPNVKDKRDEEDANDEPEIEIMLEQRSDSEGDEKAIDIDNPAPSAQLSGPLPLPPPPEFLPVDERKSTRRGPIAPPVPKPPKTEFEEDEPVIMTFDSLGGSHQPVAKVLNKWLVYEALDKAKEKTSLEESNWDLHFPAAYKAIRVPGQDNFADCGVYVLHYAVQLMTDKGSLRDYIFEKGTVKTDKDREKNKDVWNANDMSNQRENWKSLIMSLPLNKGDTAEGSCKDGKPAENKKINEADGAGPEVSTGDKIPAPQPLQDPPLDELSPYEMQQSRESSDFSEHHPVGCAAGRSSDGSDEEHVQSLDTHSFVPSPSSCRECLPPGRSPHKRNISDSFAAPKDRPNIKRPRIDFTESPPDVVDDSEADDSPVTANQPMDVDSVVSNQAESNGTSGMVVMLQDVGEERDSHITMDGQEAAASQVVGLQNVTNGMRDVQVTPVQNRGIQSTSGRPSMSSPQARNGTASSLPVCGDIATTETTGTGRRENIQIQLRNDHDAEPRQALLMQSPAKAVRTPIVNKARQQRDIAKQTLPASLSDVRRHLQLDRPALSIDQGIAKQSEGTDEWYPQWREGVDAGGEASDRVMSHLRRSQGEGCAVQVIHLPLNGDGIEHDGVTSGQNGYGAVVEVSSDDES